MQQATWDKAFTAPWLKFFSEPVTDQAARAQVIKRLELLARFLDDAFLVPGTNYRVGWDGLIGLIPGDGDSAIDMQELQAFMAQMSQRGARGGTGQGPMGDMPPMGNRRGR